jgi:hypothetical protein
MRSRLSPENSDLIEPLEFGCSGGSPNRLVRSRVGIQPDGRGLPL